MKIIKQLMTYKLKYLVYNLLMYKTEMHQNVDSRSDRRVSRWIDMVKYIKKILIMEPNW